MCCQSRKLTILGCTASKSKEAILPLYSALVRTHLHGVLHPALKPKHKKVMDLLEKVQRRVKKTIRGLGKIYEVRFSLFSLEKRRLERTFSSLPVPEGG